MKQQTALLAPAAMQPKLQIIYSSNAELAAVHLISGDGIVSYASIGSVPASRANPEDDPSWYNHYE